MLKAINGVIKICAYCGEQVASGKHCKNCKTQSGRKEIFDANVAIAKENAMAGIKTPTEFRNWK
jgi:methionyl-tRNA synthetase